MITVPTSRATAGDTAFTHLSASSSVTSNAQAIDWGPVRSGSDPWISSSSLYSPTVNARNVTSTPHTVSVNQGTGMSGRGIRTCRW